VGDAADFFDPFTGEGIFAALRGAELLAPVLIDAVRARRTTTPAWGTPYERARHRAFAGKWRVERLIGVSVSYPLLLRGAAHVFAHDRVLADVLVGVTGDFVPPRVLVSPRLLARVARAAVRAAACALLPAPIALRSLPLDVPRS
jgi:2-polyprenyl-6-methoxyphenol hydroxylase-like FAD-dependent oxidoreductase